MKKKDSWNNLKHIQITCEINKSIEVYVNRNHDHSHDFIKIVIFTLFQACVTLSQLFYIHFSHENPQKGNS
jgi:hypothetical protein